MNDLVRRLREEVIDRDDIVGVKDEELSDLLAEAADRLEVLERTRPEVGEWIKVSDRLPDEGEPVLAIEPGASWGDEKPEFHITHFAIYKQGVFMIDRPTPYCNPTYWLRLPSWPDPSLPQSRSD